MRCARKSFDERTRAEDAAVHDARAFCCSPKSEHRLAGEMENGIESVDIRRLARHQASGAHVLRTARERNNFPSATRGQTCRTATDEARSTGDTEPHQLKRRCIQR